MLVGEAAVPDDVRAIRAALTGASGVSRVIHLRTLHLGPEQVMVAAKFETGHDAEHQRGEQPRPQPVVDRAAVVRIDEGEVPAFGALVDIGDAGHGELDQLLGNGIDPPRQQ